MTVVLKMTLSCILVASPTTRETREGVTVTKISPGEHQRRRLKENACQRGDNLNAEKEIKKGLEQLSRGNFNMKALKEGDDAQQNNGGEVQRLLPVLFELLNPMRRPAGKGSIGTWVSAAAVDRGAKTLHSKGAMSDDSV